MHDTDTAGGSLAFRRQSRLGGPFTGTLVTVDDIVPGYLVLTRAHQGQFHLVLNIFNVQRAARGHASLEGSDHLFGQFGHSFVDTAARRCGASFHGEKRLGNGYRYFAVFKTCDGAVAFDDSQLPGRRCLQSPRWAVLWSRCRGGGRCCC